MSGIKRWIWSHCIGGGWSHQQYYLIEILQTKGINHLDAIGNTIYEDLHLGSIQHHVLRTLFTYGLQIRHLSRAGDVEYIMPLFTKFHIIQNIRVFEILLQHDHEGVYVRTKYIDMVKVPTYTIELSYDLRNRTFFDHVRSFWQTNIISHGEKIPREHVHNVTKAFKLMISHENKHLSLFEHMWRKTKDIQF